jgi:hypothetical protein
MQTTAADGSVSGDQFGQSAPEQKVMAAWSAPEHPAGVALIFSFFLLLLHHLCNDCLHVYTAKNSQCRMDG